MGIYQNIAKRVEAKRKELGLSMDGMATKLGVSYPTYVQWENGATKFYAEHIQKLATALGCSTDYLFFGTELSPDYIAAFQAAQTAGISARDLLLSIEYIGKIRNSSNGS